MNEIDIRNESIVESVFSVIFSEGKKEVDLSLMDKISLCPSLFSKKKPKILAFSYFNRLIKVFEIEENMILVFCLYFLKLKGLIKIGELNIHKSILACLYLALKYSADNLYPTVYYAKSAGIPLTELISVEEEVLKCLDYKLFVDNFKPSKEDYDLIKKILDEK